MIEKETESNEGSTVWRDIKVRLQDCIASKVAGKREHERMKVLVKKMTERIYLKGGTRAPHAVPDPVQSRDAAVVGRLHLVQIPAPARAPMFKIPLESNDGQ